MTNSKLLYNKYLITGPESSGTRMVSKFVANCLGVINSINDWNGRWEISKENLEIIHRSLPHGERDNYPVPSDFGDPGEVLVIICMRDRNIVHQSALNTHNKNNITLALKTQITARVKIEEFLKSDYKCVFFDFEAGVYLGKVYLDWWAKKHLGVKNKSDLVIRDENNKYII